jgi:hypothetical protein
VATHQQDEQTAWAEYLRECRLAQLRAGHYEDLERAAWKKLRARLHAAELRQERELVTA